MNNYYLCSLTLIHFSMLTGILHSHNIFRYLIIIFGVWAIVKVYQSKKARKPFGRNERKPLLIFMILMDIQLLFGLLLFYFNRYWDKLSKLSYSEWDFKSKFFLREHIPMMILSVILLHIAYGISKKKTLSDAKKYKKVLFYYILTYIIIFTSIPWPIRNVGVGWMP